jgi:dihydroorotase
VYAESKLHFTGVSSQKSLEHIDRGKRSGARISCSVTPQHLHFTDEDLKTYDSNLKVNPPIRTAADRNALRKGIEDGTIDCIATHHMPHEADSKETEFEYAKDGMTGLETAYAVLKTSMPGVKEEIWIQLLSVNPRKLLALSPVTIKENEKACLTLFCPDKDWIYEKNIIQSKSKNSPFIGKKFKGKVIGIIHKDQVHLNP